MRVRPPHAAALVNKRQLGDACEMLTAAEMTLAGVPAVIMPYCWPHYDLIAQPQRGGPARRISVKGRRFKRRGSGAAVAYDAGHDFDWLAIVLLPGDGLPERRFFILPKSFGDEHAHRDGPATRVANNRWWLLDQVAVELAQFENNFALSVRS